MLADPTRLTQAFLNLLNNAAKFTDEGGYIWLSLQRENGELVVRVRDSGVGIAPDVLPKLFEPFAQADRSLDRSMGGLGVGLALSRMLVEMHDGRIEARSGGHGTGTEFTVRLPAAAAPVTAPGATTPARREGPSIESPCAEAAATTPSTPRLRILVVDDNRDSARSMALILAAWGHETSTAHDGPGALRAAREFQPQVVLLDIGLPGIDGYEVARQLASQDSDRRPVLVAMTGYGQDEDRRRARDAGFDHHLVKPLDLAKVRSVLASVATNKRDTVAPQLQ
jgi:two-component system CheB/CheR fusion protein